MVRQLTKNKDAEGANNAKTEDTAITYYIKSPKWKQVYL